MFHVEKSSTLVCGYKIETANLWKVATAAGVLLCALGILGALGLAQHYGALNCGDGFASLIGKITVPGLGVMTGFGILGVALVALGLYKVYQYTQTLTQFNNNEDSNSAEVRVLYLSQLKGKKITEEIVATLLKENPNLHQLILEAPKGSKFWDYDRAALAANFKFEESSCDVDIINLKVVTTWHALYLRK